VNTTMLLIIISMKLTLFFLFLAGIGFFSGSETALTALSPVKVREYEHKNIYPKKYLKFWQEKFNSLLSLMLIGTNFTMIGASVVMTSIAWDINKIYPNDSLFFWLEILATMLILYLSEIVPKVYGKINAETVSFFSLPFFYHVNNLASGFIAFLIKLSEMLIAPFAGKLELETPFPNLDEFKTLLAADEIDKVLPKKDSEILENVIDFRETIAGQVMVPRVKMFAIDLNIKHEDLLPKIIEAGYSRIPVYDKSLDNIVGIIYARDLLNFWRNSELILPPDLVRPAFFVPETKKVTDLLSEFKSGHYHMAVVVDEYGGTAGIVTIEDLLEEIVGDVYDEYDVKELKISPNPDGSYLIPGDTELSKVNTELGLQLPENDFSTLNGWVLDLFGKVPTKGETRMWDTVKVEIIESTRRRVTKVKIIKK